MLLLVTILLVLVAAVTLLIGIFSDNLALIFVSIGASALAAIVLAVLSQVSRRRGRVDSATTTAPEPLPARSDVGDRAAASIAATGAPVVKTAEEAPTEVVPVTSSAAPVGAAAAAGTGAAGLAIAGYDDLRVNEILPKLEGLDLDQLEDIAQHEEGHKNRTTVLNRIDALMDEIEAGPAESSAAGDAVAEEAAASIAEIGEPVVAAADTTPAVSDGFPIPNYDALSEDEVIARLQDLDADQLETVADREEAGPNRDAVLDAIDDRLDVLEGIVPAASAAAPTKAAAPKKASAKKAPAKKVAATTTRKAAASAAPAKKAAAATRKAAASAAPAKKAAATTRKAASAAPAKKAAPTTRKAPATTATKKAAATVKKATPVKKATAAKKATKR